MKKYIKMLAGLIVGMAAGVCIAAAAAALFGNTPPAEFFHKLGNVGVANTGKRILLGGAALCLAAVAQIIVHEGGHLIGGLMSGYRFVSFRIFSITLIRRGGRWTVRRFKIAGTGGQCIMLPPDKPFGKVPFVLYNAGGVAANIAAAATAAAALASMHGKPSAAIFLLLLFTTLTGIWFALLNGIPMKIGGITNDAYNILLLRRDRDSRRHFVVQLRANALCQNGVRLKDMPGEWFADDNGNQPKGILQAATAIIQAGQQLDKGLTKAAHDTLTEIMANKSNLPSMIVMEATCELAYTSLALGHKDQARNLLTPETLAFANTMSAKQRLLCAIALHMDNNRTKAEKIYRDTIASRDKFLMAGETEMDIELMRKMIEQHDNNDTMEQTKPHGDNNI